MRGGNKKEKKLMHEPYLDFKGLLTKRGIKQKEIAKLINKTPVTVCQKINGTLDFFYHEIDIICDYLNISSDIFRTHKVA